jgi:hypothetical protein
MKFQTIQKLIIAFLTVFNVSNAGAGSTPCAGPTCELPTSSALGSNSRNDTTCYLGLVGSWHQSLFNDWPDVSAGCRFIKVKSNNDVSGVDINTRWTANRKEGKGIFDSAKVMAVMGDRSNMFEPGIGWSKTYNGLILPVFLQKDHIRIGADIAIKPDYRPDDWKNPKPNYTTQGQFLAIDGSFEINTLKKPNAVVGGNGALSCGAGQTLVPISVIAAMILFVPDDRQLNGQTCTDSPPT